MFEGSEERLVEVVALLRAIQRHTLFLFYSIMSGKVSSLGKSEMFIGGEPVQRPVQGIIPTFNLLIKRNTFKVM